MYLAFVCLSVYLLAISPKKTDYILMEILREMNLWIKKNWLYFGNHQHPPSRSRNFLKDSSTLRDGTFFPQFGSYRYLWKNWSYVHENFIRDISLNVEVHIIFWKSPGYEALLRTLDHTPELDWICLVRGLCSPCAFVIIVIYYF